MNGKILLHAVLTILAVCLLQPQTKSAEATISLGIIRVSVASDGTQGNDRVDIGIWQNETAFIPSVSHDGRFTAFVSAASNLVAGDTNICIYYTSPGHCPDVFVHDKETGITERVSTSSAGVEGNNFSAAPSISGDGRYVAFSSLASNLVNDDTDSCPPTAVNSTCPDIFVKDRQTGLIERVSLSSNGVAGNGWNVNPSISADGRFVAFSSTSTNLVENDHNNNEDVFVYDRITRIIKRVSVAYDGTEGNRESYDANISADGNFIAFVSYASNLVPSDANGGITDVFVKSLQTGEVEIASLKPDGSQATWALTPSISANGRFVAFTENKDGTTQLFLRDRQSHITTAIATVRATNSFSPSVSEDGHFLAFVSSANLSANDTNNLYDVYVYDRDTGQTNLVSINPAGFAGGGSLITSISGNGRFVGFVSQASLLPDDTNSQSDVYLLDRGGSFYSIFGRATDGTNGIGGVVITIGQSGIVPTDANGYFASNVITGTYTFSASKDGYIFSPISRNVAVPPNKTKQDFVGYQVQQGCSVSFLSQRDERWKNYPLGGNCSCNTIGTCGCVLTSVNMIFNYFGAGIIPSALSSCLGSKACPFSWTSSNSCSNSKASFVNKWPFSWARLDTEIRQNGRPVVFGMHRKSSANETHWVTIVSGRGGIPSNYTMHDPWFLGGKNLSLLLRANDYDFDWIAEYAGVPNCTSSPPRTLLQQTKTPVKPVAKPASTVVGNVWIYSADTTSMTLLLVAESTAGDIVDMQLWTDTIPFTWQPFATLINIPLGGTIHARFRDEFGNISEIVSDSLYPTASPPRELSNVYFPIILK